MTSGMTMVTVDHHQHHNDDNNSDDSESVTTQASAEVELGLSRHNSSDAHYRQQQRPQRQLTSPDQERPTKRARKGNVRRRVSRACDRCKARKTRCSGKFPCTSCAHMKLDCRFTAAYRRGRPPSIEASDEPPAIELMASSGVGKLSSRDRASRASVGSSGAIGAIADMPSLGPLGDAQATITVSVVEDQLADQLANQLGHGSRLGLGGGGTTIGDAGAGGADPTGSGLRAGLGAGLGANGPSADFLLSSCNSPEPTQTDQQGHYVGPSSGVAFLLRLQRKLQKRMHPGSSNASIFTFGDLPLPHTDPSFVILPPRNEAEIMVKRYFDFAIATHRFLHRATVEGWLAELYDTNGAMRDQETARSRTALLFMVFAQSTSFPTRASSLLLPHVPHAADSSARFFSAAEHQLSAEKGRIRLTSVQARLAQCFYLLAHSRLNHCWSLFGTTAHLVIALGIHRKTRLDHPSSSSSSATQHQPPQPLQIDYIDLECRKRTFWCAYNLDIYLSSALGRPRTFHDEDIDQDLPGCVDDSQLSGALASPPIPKQHSIMSGPVAHYRLSRILSGVLRDMYGIRPPSRSERLRLAERYTERLSSWRTQVSYLLDTDGDSSIFVRIVLRQRDLLKMAFWHAQILVHRPFLLENFARLTGDGGGGRRDGSGGSSSSDGDVRENVKQCLNAAMGIARLIHEIDVSEQLYGTMFLIPYFGFSAVVVLYVHAIQQRNSPPEKYMAALNAATLCHNHLSSMASTGSLTERYGVVLQELRNELLQQHSNNGNNPYLASSSSVSGLSGLSSLSGMSGLSAATAPPSLSSTADTIEPSSRSSSTGASHRGGGGGSVSMPHPHVPAATTTTSSSSSAMSAVSGSVSLAHAASAAPVSTVPVSITEQRDLMDMMRGSDGLSLGSGPGGGGATAVDDGGPPIKMHPHHHIHHHHSLLDPALTVVTASAPQPPPAPAMMFPPEDSPGGGGNGGGSPMAQLTGWGQFDSLVTGGTGGRLDAFFAESALENWDMALDGRVGS